MKPNCFLPRKKNPRVFRHSITGFTLIEVVIAAALVAVTLGGVLILSLSSQDRAVSNLLRELALHQAQSKLNFIMCLDFTDPQLVQFETSNSGNVLYTQYQNIHLPANNLNFSNSDSGVYESGADESLIDSGGASKILDFSDAVEFQHPWKQRYSEARIDEKNPFPVFSTPSKPWVTIANYLGKENDDCKFFINSSGDNVFWMDEDDARRMLHDRHDLAFADDVDDFDGAYFVTQNVYLKDDVSTGVEFLIEVAVRPHYRNYTNISDTLLTASTNAYSYAPLNDTAPTDKFMDMGEINTDRFFSNSAISPVLNDPLISSQRDAARELAYKLYHECIFKEVVVTVSWQYPAGAETKSISLFAIKPSGNSADVFKTL